jgi:hypothetical protein
MTKEELVKELQCVDEEFSISSADPIWNNLAEYLLENYHMIPKDVKCYEGYIDIGCLGNRGYAFYFGNKPKDYGGNETSDARLFIEATKTVKED